MEDYFPKAGAIFADRYRILSELGRGGFARIYLAKQVDLGRKVALKVLNPSRRTKSGGDTSLVERFRREAKLVATLRDPHTVTMYDYGQTTDSLFFMVFEHIDGENLSELLKRAGRIAPARVAAIVRQCLMSLQEAHSMGMLHRDIKPANIMLYEHVGRRDQVKVLDFGIAKGILEEQDDTFAAELTQTGTIVGTPRYMAPEQLRQGDLSPATDLFSLGLVAFELLTETRAVKADSLVGIITEQVSPEVIELPEQVAMPRAFRQIINHMLEKSPKHRYQSAQEVLDDLDCCDWNAFDSGDWHAAKTRVSAMDLPGPDSNVSTGLGSTSNAADVVRAEVARRDRARFDSAGFDSAGFDSAGFDSAGFDPAGSDPARPDSTASANPSVRRVRERLAEENVVTQPSGVKPRWVWGATLAGMLLCVAVAAYGLVSHFSSSTDPSQDELASAQRVASSSPTNQPPTGDTAAPAFAAHDRQDEPAPSRSMAITTDPPGATVEINGREIGVTPLSVQADALEFPATVSAQMPDGRHATRRLAGPKETLALELEDAAIVEDSARQDQRDESDEEAARDEPEDRVEPTPEPRRKRKSRRSRRRSSSNSDSRSGSRSGSSKEQEDKSEPSEEDSAGEVMFPEL